MPARAKSPAPGARLTRRQQKQEEDEIAAILELSSKTVELDAEPEAQAAPSTSAPVAAPAAGELPNKSGRPSVILAAAGAPLYTPAEKPSWRLPVMPPAWVNIWFIVNALVVCWDAAYVLNRGNLSNPATFAGRNAWIWRPYELYGSIDKLYGMSAASIESPWNATQSWLNLAEVAATVVYLLLANWSDVQANVLAIVISSATAYKTITYFVIEAASGWENTAHNNSRDFWLGYILPSSFWIVVPLLVIGAVSNRVTQKLEENRDKVE